MCDSFPSKRAGGGRIQPTAHHKLANAQLEGPNVGKRRRWGPNVGECAAIPRARALRREGERKGRPEMRGGARCSRPRKVRSGGRNDGPILQRLQAMRHRERARRMAAATSNSGPCARARTTGERPVRMPLAAPCRLRRRRQRRPEEARVGTRRRRLQEEEARLEGPHRPREEEGARRRRRRGGGRGGGASARRAWACSGRSWAAAAARPSPRRRRTRRTRRWSQGRQDARDGLRRHADHGRLRDAEHARARGDDLRPTWPRPAQVHEEHVWTLTMGNSKNVAALADLFERPRPPTRPSSCASCPWATRTPSSSARPGEGAPAQILLGRQGPLDRRHGQAAQGSNGEPMTDAEAKARKKRS